MRLPHGSADGVNIYFPSYGTEFGPQPRPNYPILTHFDCSPLPKPFRELAEVYTSPALALGRELFRHHETHEFLEWALDKIAYHLNRKRARAGNCYIRLTFSPSGKHRSVAMAGELANGVGRWRDIKAFERHRDIRGGWRNRDRRAGILPS